MCIRDSIYIGGGETRAMLEVAEIIRELRDSYPDIHFHLYSGNASDVTERLDKGLLDFGILIQPADISRYNYINPVSYTHLDVYKRQACHRC